MVTKRKVAKHKNQKIQKKKPKVPAKRGLQSLLDQRSLELEILSALSRTFWTVLDRQIFSQNLHRLLGKRFKFDALLFLLLDRDDHQLFLTSGHRLRESEQGNIREKLLESLDPRMYPEGAADIRMIPSRVSNGEKGLKKSPSWADGSVHTTPIAILNKVHGYIGLAFSGKSQLGKEESDFLQVVANEIALVEENQRIQASLISERNLLMSILHSMTCAVLVVDERMRVLLSNPMMDMIFGWKSERVVGQPLNKVTDVAAVLSLFKVAAQQSNEFMSSEIELPNLGQKRKMVAMANLAKVRGTLGQSNGVLMVLNDVTQEKEMERARTEFVSVASHELRTPMAAIREAVSLVIDGVTGPINEKQNKFLDMARRNIDRLTGIVNDLLDLSKIESGNLTINREPVTAQKIVDEAFAIFEAAAREKEISLLKDVAGGLPVLQLDHDKMIQVLGNLVNNAIKFTPKDGMITIGARMGQQKESNLEFYVQDTGIGIERKNYGKLFRKFQQIDSSLSRAVGGTGLGLAISREIVELHGGRVWMESEPGRGSIFHVVIPVDQSGTSRKRRVLLVSSDMELDGLFKDALEEKTFEVSGVTRGKDLNEAVLESRPDLIFLDSQLPDADVFDLCRRLAEDPYTAFVPIVLLTALGQESLVWKALSVGVRGYLVRPIDSKTVRSIAEEILT